MTSKAERLLNLVAVLRETGRPLTAGEIRRKVPGYPDSEKAFRRAFERDKAALREMGYKISKEPMPASQEALGYRIKDSKRGLPDPGLTEEERAAMAVALSAVSVISSGDSDSQADPDRELLYGAVKIGLDPEPDGESDLAAFVRVPHDRLAVLVEAMLDRRMVEFEYEKSDGKSSSRTVEPHGLRCIRNNWYLAASEPGEDGIKVFRIDRIRSGIRPVSDPNSFDPRDVSVVDEVLAGPPWSIGGGSFRTAEIAVVKEVSGLARRIFGRQPSGHTEDGRILFEVEFKNPDPLIDALGALRDKAEVIKPAELRSRIREKLTRAAKSLEASSAAAAGDEAMRLALAARSDISGEDRADRQRADRKKKRHEAGERARRLVNMVPWLMRNPGVSIDEVASRFAVPRDVVIKDLTMATLTGVYPYTPDSLVDISLSDDRVIVRSADYLRSFSDMTAEEAVVLYSALRVAARLPGLEDSPELISGIAKVGRALGIGDSEVEIVAERADPSILELLRRAISERKVVSIRYVSYSSEKESQRDVEPYRLFVYDGRWYLDCYCRLSQDERIFRVSRILDAALCEESFSMAGDAREASAAPDSKFAGGRLPGAEGWRIEGIDLELALPPEVASWFVRSYPTTRAVELQNGWSYVRLKASSLTWATKVLFGIADRIRVIAPPIVTEELAGAIRRALDLYSRDAE